MNRSAEQTNRPRTASRFTRFVCPALRFIPHEPRKKDTHSLNELESSLIKIESSLFEIESSLIQFESSLIQLVRSLIIHL